MLIEMIPFIHRINSIQWCNKTKDIETFWYVEQVISTLPVCNNVTVKAQTVQLFRVTLDHLQLENKVWKMIKFRYKRKETTNNGCSNSSSLVKSNNIKSLEIKLNDSKDDNKHKTLKCETSDAELAPQMIKVKTRSEQEYMDGCIRAIVVSY